MAKLDIRKLDHQVKLSLLIVSALTLAVLGAAALMENIFPEWRKIRLEYAEILESKAIDERSQAIADQFEIGIDQNVVPSLNAIDRCITCHTGLEDPRMTDQQNPFRTHPGDFLSTHPTERFGCVVCHQGQGRATESHDAHGKDEHWLYPMYAKEFLYSSCSQCHDRKTFLEDKLFTKKPDQESLSEGVVMLARGKELLDSKGCIGCHMMEGRGGSLGPDISYVGDKTRHDFDFSHLEKNGPRDVAFWLKTHFLEPQKISPETVMPDLSLSDSDATALTAYVLSLKRGTSSSIYKVPIPDNVIEPLPPTGEELYMKMCSACHGSDGRQSDVPGIRTPALNNVDSLAAASDDYYRHIIFEGRTDTAMPAWDNLTTGEVDQLVAHIRSWEPEGAALADVNRKAGVAKMGEAYFRGLCANCHGNSGEGGIGNALNSPSFLSIVSDGFLAETIIHGRPGTAMASWKHLPSQAVNDLIAYIRTWEAEPPSFEAVQASRTVHPPEDNVRVGKILFKSNCATCHGAEGNGGIGPILNSRDAISIYDDEFIYRTIVEGRPTTAMPAWRYLAAGQIGSIMDYMRSWRNGESVVLAQAPLRGDYDLGKIHFDAACVECHGDSGRGGVGPQLANPAFLSAASDDMLYHWISKGRSGTSMKGFGPEEQGVVRLTPGHVADVIAYLRSEAAKPERPILRSGVGNANLGKELFDGSCIGCHGVDGVGASGPQLHNSTFMRSASDGFLKATIVLGRTGTPMQSMIHGQEGLGQIEPEQVQDIIAYMREWDISKSWSKPRSVAEMSERAILSGKEYFGRYCSGCHGPNGLGANEGEDFLAPALNNREFLAAASDGFLLATIARGRSGTPMRPFGIGAGGIARLDAEVISDIVSYIRTWQEAYTQEGD